MSYTEFRSSKLGERIAPILRDPKVIGRMETLSREGRPAVLAVDEPIGEIGASLTDTQKQHVGRFVRDVLGDRGWRPVGKKRLSNGRVFASGTVYRRIGATDARPPESETMDAAAWLERARALVRQLPAHPGTVDDFIAEKRRDAAGED